MSEEQLNRFEFFSRAHLSRSLVKEILFSRLGTRIGKSAQDIPDEIAIVIGGLAKLFAGEIVESGRIYYVENRIAIDVININISIDIQLWMC